MQTGFFTAYQRLSKSEKSEFDGYLNCFYKKHLREIRVFELIKKQREIDEQHLFQHLYGRAFVHNEEKRLIQNIISNLKKILLEFIACKEIQRAPASKCATELRLESLRNRGWFDLYIQQVERIKELQAKKEPTSIDDLLERIQVLHHHFYFANDEQFNNSNTDLVEMKFFIQQYYQAASYKINCELLSREKVINTGNKMQHLDEQIADNSVSNLQKDSLPLWLYRTVFNMVSEQDESLFKNVKKVFQTDELSKEDQWIILMYLVNFAIRMANKGDSSYLNELFYLYSTGLERGLFNLSGFFPIGPFHNIVTLACQLKKYEWAHQFVKNNYAKLPETEREVGRQLSEAKILVDNKQLEEGRKLLQTLPSNSFSDSLQSRILRIRLYYELTGFDDLLKSECENLYQFARRNHYLSSDYKILINNFVKIVKIITQNRRQVDLHNVLSENSPTLAHSWLVEKINELPLE